MTGHHSVAEAKSKFSEVLNLAKESPQFISNRGKDVGVILSIETYQSLVKVFEENLPTSKIQNFLKVSQTLSENLNSELVLPERKSRDLPSLEE
jgi:prevent-host-death family protein